MSYGELGICTQMRTFPTPDLRLHNSAELQQ